MHVQQNPFWGAYYISGNRDENLQIYLGKGKGKAIPLQAWTGHKDSRRLRLPDFKTIGT
jgi:hypothetical protein